MGKIAVILHGYPSEENQSTPIGQLLKTMGYELVVPRYMESDSEFNIEWIKKEVKKLLNDRKPDVLIGVSLGGLVLPNLASEYPEAKLIFVATGTRFKPKLKFAEEAVKMATGAAGVKVATWVSQAPESLLKQIYDLVHKVKTSEDREFCEKDKEAIIKALRVIKPHKHGELAKFILNTDTRNIVGKIKNKTLVLSGTDDLLMPVDVGRELAENIKGCDFEMINAEHFNVLNSNALQIVAKWLSGVAK